MKLIPQKSLVSAVLLLFLASLFLSFEFVRLMADAPWKEEEIGFFVALYAIQMIAGFIFVSANKRNASDFLYISGALLLTLHAGVIHNSLHYIINFIIFGAVSAFLIRSRKSNTFLPLAAALAAGLVTAVCFSAHALLLSFVSGMLLTGMLIVSAAGFRHIRWLFLPLILIQAFLFPADQKKVKDLRDYRDMRDVAVSTLPASLLTENNEKNLTVLQITRSSKLQEIALWKVLPGIDSVTSCRMESFLPVGVQLDAMEQTFDIVSVEILPDWSEAALKNLLKKLAEKVSPEHGIMLFPRSVLKFMPQNKNFITIPGSEKRRLAAVPFQPEDVSLEKLDRRLQKRLKYFSREDLMLPGVFPALFNENPEKVDFTPPASVVTRHSLFFWITLGLCWILFRIIVARKGKNASFFAALDNSCSAVVIALTGFCLFSENRIYTCFPETFFLFALVFALPFWRQKKQTEKLFLLFSIIFPWFFTDPDHSAVLQIIIFLTVMITAVSSGMTAGKLMLETSIHKKRVIFATLTGICLGGVIFHLFFAPGNLIPILIIASLLRVGNLLRE
jgi:hypothetical protein